MKKYVFLLLTVLMIFAVTACGEKKQSEDTAPTKVAEENRGTDKAETEAPLSSEWVTKLPQAKDAKQLFVVCAHEKTTAWVSMHQKDEEGNWREIMSTPGFIGVNGLGKTKEGDGMTPIGEFKFNRAFGIQDDPGCAIPYLKVDDDTYWSGDQRDGYHYNELVDIKDYPDLDKENSEHIVDYVLQYQYCLNISYNEKGVPGGGSAIFLHCFGFKPYTGGCISIPFDKMEYVMKNVDPDCVVVIDYQKNFGCDELILPEWQEEQGKDAVGNNETEATPDNAEPAGNDTDTEPQAGTDDEMVLSDDSSDFVLLSEAVPDAILEIRYYSTYNFIGERIDGYEEPVAFLTKEAATALKEASDELAVKGYRLKIYDAYRPQMAVDHFVRWAKNDDTKMKDYFYPELEKNVLFPQGYIAEHSGHSRGSTVDLTLFDMRTEKEVDMGGTFDYFGELSHPDYKEITDEQYANRMILRDAMVKHGFKPLEEEWWHFTLENEPYPDTYFTFPVNSDSAA